MKRDWCRGAGMTAPLKPPTGLLDCPVCGRQNLNGELPAAHGLCADIRDGVAWYVVPRHRAAPMRYKAIVIDESSVLRADHRWPKLA